MKTETQIAKENIKAVSVWNNKLDAIGKYNKGVSKTQEGYYIHKDEVTSKVIRGRKIEKAETHKASCQRFLEFLESMRTYNYLTTKGFTPLVDKITDLKQAIKLYEDNGI